MSDYITDTARRVLVALKEQPLAVGALHYDVRVLAQDVLIPSDAVEAPEDLGNGVYRWTGQPGPRGWFVQLYGDGGVLVCGLVPAGERARLLAIVRAAHALAAQLPDPDKEDA